MRTKGETAQFLADAHFRLDQGITRIFRIIGPDEDNDLTPVKFLEVSPITIEVGIQPVGMGRDSARGVHYASVIVEISPDEFERLKRGELQLPHDWWLGDELFPNTSAMSAAS